MEVLIRQQGDEIRHFSRALAQVEVCSLVLYPPYLAQRAIFFLRLQMKT